MNKPEITGGTWEVMKRQKYDRINPYKVKTWIDSKKIISECAPYEFWNMEIEECQANSQAISAVPELIDALIEAYEELLILQTKDNKEFDDTIMKIEQALLKAGCYE